MPSVFFTFIFLLQIPAEKSAVSDLNFKLGLETYTLGQYIAEKKSTINIDNRVFKSPRWAGDLDLRPSAKMSFRDLKFVAEPRFELQPQWIPHPLTKNEFRLERNFSLTQLYASCAFSDALNFSGGVQNFQWGPAELMTPSNPLIHFDPRQKSIFWVEKGRGLLKINYSLGENFSLIALTQIFDNKIPDWIAGYDSKYIGLLKIEFQKGGSDYIGLTGGKGDKSRVWIGEYASLGLLDGLSVYGDARHTLGSDAFYPATTQNGISLERIKSESSRMESLADLGIRFDGRLDIRGEFLINSYGFTKREFNSSLQTALLSGSLTSVESSRALHPGLELPGKYYLYQSIRINDLGPGKRITLLERYLHSLMDQSGIGFLSTEIILNDFMLAVAELAVPRGESNREFTLSEGISIQAGFKFSF
ncbi:MAG: hypothetical protein JWQ35_2350 [Bacteriovoracaceae bacterium]|nr:hypothetical protein [Bacteriovoracaceae bacterium]